MNAKFTGRDLSGQKVLTVSDEDVTEYQRQAQLMGLSKNAPSCEDCGRLA